MTYLLIAIGALLRVIPHPFNFTPLAATALFGGAYLSKKQAIIVPLVAMMISDFFIGFDSWESRLMVYSTLVFASLLGMTIKKDINVLTIAATSVASSVIFFLITNNTFFYSPSLYPHTWSGMITSYEMGLPFIKNTILGDLIWSGVFFGAYALVQMRYATRRKIQNLA